MVKLGAIPLIPLPFRAAPGQDGCGVLRRGDDGFQVGIGRDGQSVGDPGVRTGGFYLEGDGIAAASHQPGIVPAIPIVVAIPAHVDDYLIGDARFKMILTGGKRVRVALADVFIRTEDDSVLPVIFPDNRYVVERGILRHGYCYIQTVLNEPADAVFRRWHIAVAGRHAHMQLTDVHPLAVVIHGFRQHGYIRIGKVIPAAGIRPEFTLPAAFIPPVTVSA